MILYLKRTYLNTPMIYILFIIYSSTGTANQLLELWRINLAAANLFSLISTTHSGLFETLFVWVLLTFTISQRRNKGLLTLLPPVNSSCLWCVVLLSCRCAASTWYSMFPRNLPCWVWYFFKEQYFELYFELYTVL